MRRFTYILVIVIIIGLGVYVGCNKITNSTENDQTAIIENIKKEASGYEETALSESDFQVVYQGVTIGRDLSEEDITGVLDYPPTYEENNSGNISSGNGYRRWELCYPDYHECEISVVFLSRQEVDENGAEYHGKGYIVFVKLYAGTETARGISIGDSREEVFKAYGQPMCIQTYSAEEELMELIYQQGENQLAFVLDEVGANVKFIMIYYRMEQAGQDQFGEEK